MELIIDRPLVNEHPDRTQSSRPPREELAPDVQPAPILSSLIDRPEAQKKPTRLEREIGAVLAFWGD